MASSVGGSEQRSVAVVDHPCVVAGRKPGGAKPAGELDHRLEPHTAVATDTRVRRHSGRIAGQERIDDTGAEVLAQIDGQVRDPHLMGDAAGEPHRLRRAAALFAVVGGVRPELERHREDLRPAPLLEMCGRGAVDAAAHRNEHARGLAGARRLEQGSTRHHGFPERPVQGVGGELGAVAADRT